MKFLSRNLTLSTLALVGFAILTLEGCAPAPGGSATPGRPVAGPTPDPKTPEPHGHATVGEVKREEAATPTPESSATPEPEIIEPKVVSTIRHPLCKDSFDPKKPQAPGLTCPVCMSGQFTQPEPKRVKLDLLFVADSSPSLESSRLAIARGIQKFVDQLPRDTDYRMAVMAAHSDVSYDQKNKPSTGLAGKLIVAGGEPAVLQGSSDLTKLSNDLARKLVRMKSDAASDGGELGLFSLNKGITSPLLEENQRLGFFREDAGLAVIFISDENDICSYGVNYKDGEVPKKNVNNYLKTGLTVEEKANQVYCRDQAGNPTVTNVTVYDKLLNLKKIKGSSTNAAQPLLISGIIYTDDATIPKIPPASEQYPQYYPEKEVGHGYLEMIQANNGEKVDLAKGNFSDGLKQIGEAAAIKLEVKTEFVLKEGSAVDLNTLCVVVDGKEVRQVPDFDSRVSGLTFLYSDSNRALHLRGVGARNGGGGASKVDFFYCEPPSVLDFDPERFAERDMPTSAEHYRNLPVPKACGAVTSRIQSGKLDNL